MDGTELRNAFAAIASVLLAGEGTHPPDSSNHWLKLTAREHTRRAMIHAEKFILGVLVDSNEDELAHAACRLLLALKVRELNRIEQPARGAAK